MSRHTARPPNNGLRAAVDVLRPLAGQTSGSSSRSARNRGRQFDTMFRDTPTASATSPIVPPCAHPKRSRPATPKPATLFAAASDRPETGSSPDNGTGSAFQAPASTQSSYIYKRLTQSASDRDAPISYPGLPNQALALSEFARR